MSNIQTSNGVIGTYVALKKAPMTFSDTVNITFGKTPYPAWRGARAFTPDQTGTLRVIYHDDSFSDESVTAGERVVLAVKRFNVTGTIGVTSGEMEN